MLSTGPGRLRAAYITVLTTYELSSILFRKIYSEIRQL